MPSYRRNNLSGGTYFFTVNLQDRTQTYLADYIDILRDAVRTVKNNRPFKIDAWVVLPDHMHAIWTLPKSDSDYSSRWREIKKKFTKELRRLGINPPIWQNRFWEHTIRDQKDFNHHFDYVHINPLKHRHVLAVKEWPYSTFHRSVKEGVYPIDWGLNVQLEPINEFE